MLSLSFESLSLRERILTASALICVMLMVYLSFWYEPLRRSMIEQQQLAPRLEPLNTGEQEIKLAPYVKLERTIRAATPLSVWLDKVLAEPAFDGLTEFDYLGSSELSSYTSGTGPLYAHSINLKLSVPAYQLFEIHGFLASRQEVLVERLVWSAGAAESSGELLVALKVFNPEPGPFAMTEGVQ